MQNLSIITTPDERPKFTAAQIAAALGIKPQSVRGQLRDVPPASVVKVNGQDAVAWTLDQLPAKLRERLALKAKEQGFSSIHAMLSMRRFQIPPRIPLDKICQADREEAEKLRSSLKPFLTSQPETGLSAEAWKRRGVDYYFNVFRDRPRITTRYWDKLYRRAQRLDNGCEDWDSIQIYLPDRLKRDPAPGAPGIDAADMVQGFDSLENFIGSCRNPGDLNREEREGLWALVLAKFTALVHAGEPEKSAARRVRQYLFARASFLAPSRDALWITFKRKLSSLEKTNGNLREAVRDGRTVGGSRVEYPSVDIRRVRHSAVRKNGGEIDRAWREEYPYLSEYTHQRHERSRKCPRALRTLVNREKVNALMARIKGKRALRHMIGGVARNTENTPSMFKFVVDDITSDIEVYTIRRDGKPFLFRPQIIATMDSSTRKMVGVSCSADAGPTAQNVCASVESAFHRHGVSKKLGLENGWVFGRALAVNGKKDDFGKTLVAGLAQYGCEIEHFGKDNPRAKAELEKSIHLFQKLMTRHPGYGGPIQMLHASDDFKSQQREINGGDVHPGRYRYSFDQFKNVLEKIIDEYNATPQYGTLNGLSPDQVFELKKPSDFSPQKLDPKLKWFLNPSRALVWIKVGGAGISWFGRKMQVRGGELPQHIGEQMWALPHGDEIPMVSFVSQDFRHSFTVEANRTTDLDASATEEGKRILTLELGKNNQHFRAVTEDLKSLDLEYGNPQQTLLADIQRETNILAGADELTRKSILNTRLDRVGEQISQQSSDITAAKEQKTRRTSANKSKARRLGIPSVMVDDDEQTRRGLELLGAGPRASDDGIQTPGETEA